MELKDVIEKFEEIMDAKLNEESIQPLIEPILKDLLSDYVRKEDALSAADLAAREADKPKMTFSKWLGDNARYAAGQPTQWTDKPEDYFIPTVTGISPEIMQNIFSKAGAPAEAIQKALYTSANASGGYLGPTEESRQLLDLTSNWEIIPPLCQQVPMRTNTITYPTLIDGVIAYWIPEPTSISGSGQSGGVKQASDPTFGQMTITTHVLAILVYVSNQLLDDSDPRVDQILFGIFGRTLGAYFDLACLQGAGTAVDPVTGLDNLVTTNVLNVGAALDYDDIIDLIWGIYAQAKGPTTRSTVRSIMHSLAEMNLMKIKDNEDNYIYKRPTVAGGVSSLWGQPVDFDHNITITAGGAGNETLIYAGDFANYAYVGNSMNMTIKANPWMGSAFTRNMTAFLAEFRRGFQVSDESLFAILNGVPTT